MIDLGGKLGLVMGGTSGIGRDIALRFAEAGANVIATGRSAGRLPEIAAALRARGGDTLEMACDATEPEEVRRLFGAIRERWGRLDILVNSQGIHHKKSSAEVGDEQFAEVIAVNLNSVFSVCREAYPLLKAAEGCIINLASMASFIGLPDAAAYTASKGGVGQLTKALARDWAADGIRCNAIAPGWIETRLTQPALSQAQYRDPILARIPLGRLGTVRDVSGVALFLASPLAAYVTGEIVRVDGGALAAI